MEYAWDECRCAGWPGPTASPWHNGSTLHAVSPIARRALSATPLAADTNDMSMHSTTDDSLLECEAALRRAQLSSDVGELDRLLDEELVFTGPDGALYSKADDLDAHRNGMVRITRLEASEERIQRFGDVAIVIVRMDMSGTFRDEAFSGPFRYTRIWCARPEGWRIVAGHVSAVIVSV